MAFSVDCPKPVCLTCSKRKIRISLCITLTEADVLYSSVTVTKQPGDTVGRYCSRMNYIPIKLTSIDYTRKIHPLRVN